MISDLTLPDNRHVPPRRQQRFAHHHAQPRAMKMWIRLSGWSSGRPLPTSALQSRASWWRASKRSLRRFGARRPAKTFRIGDLTIDSGAMRPRWPASRLICVLQRVRLFAQTLAENKGIVLSREKLLELGGRVLDRRADAHRGCAHVAHLRKSINHSTAQIETVTGATTRAVSLLLYPFARRRAISR